MERATSLARREGTDVCDRSRRTVLNWAGATLAGAAAFGFYTAVMASPYSGMTRYERSVLNDVKGHEIAHREFFRKALGSSRIPELKITFPSVDFGDRGSVLRTASMFEDSGVSAYNGAGALLTGAEHVATVGTLFQVLSRDQL